MLYFEAGWSILSTIGLSNAFSGLMVIGIIGVTRLSIIPVIVSVACALANGLCFYAFYTDYDFHSRIAASVLADITWLVQEVGLNFYSYQILRNLLEHPRRTIYLAVFWIFIVCITCIRVAIAVVRALEIAYPTDQSYQTHLARLHIGYFTGIALLESWSSYFLLSVLLAAHSLSAAYFPRLAGVQTWRYLIRSTEVRVALLAIIGIARACTYSFQNSPTALENTPSQVDRFFYTLECMFPVILIIDLIASKLPSANRDNDSLTELTHHSSEPDKGSIALVEMRSTQQNSIVTATSDVIVITQKCDSLP